MYYFFLITGFQNTPRKGSRICADHEILLSPFIDDSGVSNANISDVDFNKEILPVRTVNEKETRQGKL